ncbi:hypothetical protein GW17_00015492 [Ensete ventricosum]|nr:hypothetical protein GW17_00015492 [Ensete ventricosum]
MRRVRFTRTYSARKTRMDLSEMHVHITGLDSLIATKEGKKEEERQMGRGAMEAAILFFFLFLFLFLSSPVTGDGSGEDYVRPLPRQTLSLPWRPKRSSDPHQVIISAIGS